MKNYLVTGAAGFIGSNLAKKLMDSGNHVVTIDNLSTGYEYNLPDGIEYINGDCQDDKVLAKLGSRQFDAILHLAGQSSGEVSFDDPIYDLNANALTTLKLLDYAVNNNCSRFVFASTMSSYGDHDDTAIVETDATFPKSFYGATKLFAEHYLRLFSLHHGLPTCALRLYTTYGCNQDMNNFRQGMVSIFLGQAMKNGHIHIKGSKDRFRDFINVSDVADAFIAAAQSKQEGFNFYNVCNGDRVTIEMLLNEIVGLFDKEIPMRFEGSTPGDQFGTYGDNSKIKAELGWTPKVSLAEGLKEMHAWVEENRSRFNY